PADARRRGAAGALRLRRQCARTIRRATRPALASAVRAMAKIQIAAVSKAFGHGVPALTGIDLDVAEHEFVCLLGPSGCGKSTLLNIVAGFLAPTGGRVLVDGAPVTGPGADRGVVFQEYVLFPWLTVAGNVEFGLTLTGAPAEVRRRTAARYIEMVGLRAHAEKFPV